ncbi:MAG: hypothetical protein R3E12_10590, partial [Candidatus Eisenbacteria bacterium]
MARLCWTIPVAFVLGCSSEGGTSPRSDTVAPGQVQDLVATRVTDDSVSLRWTAPGDDEFAGQASVYEIRYGTDALTEAEWEGGTPIERVPTPRAAGLEDRTGQGGLARGRWYFALRSADEELNWSSISNIATADLGDTIPPSAVTDLEVFGFEETNVTLTWTAPGDDGADGLATAYDLRRDQKPITEVGWEEATRVDPPPVPIEAGSSERFTVIGLSEGQRYFFALRAEDDSGNLAALSNLVVATTSRDTIPPATITDLEVTFEGGRNVNLRWTAPGNNGQQGQAARYDLRLDDDPITSDSWEQASPVAGLPPPGITGADESFTVTGLDLDRGYHFAIRTEDEFGNRSDVSNDVAAMTMSLVILTQSSGPRLVDSPDWEPNGSRIVFSGYVGDQRQLLWVHSTGGNAVQITYRPDGVYSPRWSTDGQRLVCIAQRNQFPTVFDEVAVLEAREGAVPV